MFYLLNQQNNSATACENAMNVLTFASQNVGKPQAQAFGVQAIENNNFDYLSENFEYTQNSPFTVDMSDVLSTIDSITLPTDSTLIATKKFKCIYDKLTQSPKFKTLFIDTFNESPSMHVKIKISSTLPQAINGVTTSSLQQVNDIEIQINKNLVLNDHPLYIAQTIIHEALHAFLKVKKKNCDSSTLISDLNQLDFGELMNDFNYNCIDIATDDHNLMFNVLIPIMNQMLEDIQPVLVDSNDISNVTNNAYYFYHGIPPATTISNQFNWPDCYFYLNLMGFWQSRAYKREVFISPGNPNPPHPEYETFKIEYRNFLNGFGGYNFNKNCNE